GVVNAYLTTNLFAGMTWNNPPVRQSSALASFGVKAGRPDCSPGGYTAEFNVSPYVRARVLASQPYTTISLAGQTESNDSSWMRFAGPNNPTVAYRPRLSVTYNSTPSTPSTAKMFAPDTNTTCAPTPATSKALNNASSTARFIATGADPD